MFIQEPALELSLHLRKFVSLLIRLFYLLISAKRTQFGLTFKQVFSVPGNNSAMLLFRMQ